MDVGLTGLTRDIQVVPDVFPVIIDETAAVPMPLHVVVETEPQDDVRRETALSVVSQDDEMTLWIDTVGLSVDGNGCQVELLNSGSDWCFMDNGVVVTGMFSAVSARGAAVSTFLPTISDVFSSAVLDGGGDIAEAAPVAEAAPLAVVGTVTARVSALPDVGSQLPADSNRVAVVCSAPVNEAVDDAMGVVSLRVGQWWFRTDSAVVLPLIANELCVISDLVHTKTDVCGDERFSPGVKDYSSLGSRDCL